MYQPPSYPVVQFFLRRGSLVAAGFALLPLLGTTVLVGAGAPAWALAAGAVVGAAVWLLMKSYMEVLAIIADTLLPK